MRILTATLLITFFLIGLKAQDNTNQVSPKPLEQFNKIKADNDNLSDETIMEFAKNMHKFMPQVWDEIVNSKDFNQKQYLQNFRDHHSYVGISIAELLSESEEESMAIDFLAHIWAQDTLGVEYARSVKSNLTNVQSELILEAGIGLINEKKDHKAIILDDDFPESLSFLKVHHIRYSNYYCEIYVYKGVGSMKSIGFLIEKGENEWKLSWFNYLESYDSNELLARKEYLKK